MNHRNLRDSARDFREIVWPHFQDALGGGELVTVETVTESGFAKALDTLGLTDAWQVVSPYGIRGLSSRVQWGVDYGTWSVRYSLPSGQPTEFHKLIQSGHWHRPSYVIQAYLAQRGGPLLRAACIATEDLAALLRGGCYRGPIPVRGGNKMLVIDWDEARAHCEVLMAEMETATQ